MFDFIAQYFYTCMYNFSCVCLLWKIAFKYWILFSTYVYCINFNSLHLTLNFFLISVFFNVQFFYQPLIVFIQNNFISRRHYYCTWSFIFFCTCTRRSVSCQDVGNSNCFYWSLIVRLCWCELNFNKQAFGTYFVRC